jgi:hypothetical protein
MVRHDSKGMRDGTSSRIRINKLMAIRNIFRVGLDELVTDVARMTVGRGDVDPASIALRLSWRPAAADVKGRRAAAPLVRHVGAKVPATRREAGRGRPLPGRYYALR